MGWGRGGGPDETSGGDTPTGRGGRGSGGTPVRGGAMGARGGIPDRERNILTVNKDFSRGPPRRKNIIMIRIKQLLHTCCTSGVLVLPKPVCGGSGSGGCFILGGSVGGRG